MQNSIKFRSRLGDKINDYVVIAQYKNEVILAQAVNPKELCQAVVWYLDYQGEPHTGEYYLNLKSAYNEFISRSFGEYV